MPHATVDHIIERLHLCDDADLLDLILKLLIESRQ